MHDPNLNYLWAREGRANERYDERLKEAQAHRLANLALGDSRAPRQRLPARLVRAPRLLLGGALRLLRQRRWSLPEAQ